MPSKKSPRKWKAMTKLNETSRRDLEENTMLLRQVKRKQIRRHIDRLNSFYYRWLGGCYREQTCDHGIAIGHGKISESGTESSAQPIKGKHETASKQLATEKSVSE